MAYLSFDGLKNKSNPALLECQMKNNTNVNTLKK
jgi:hypothetical protein